MAFELEKECTKAQKDGAPVPIIDLSIKDGAPYFIIRRMGTRAFREELAEIRKERESWYNLRSVFDEHDVIIEWLWRFGITGWSDDIQADGKPLPFSKQACKDLVTDESYVAYVNCAIKGAQDQYNYLASTIAEISDRIKKS